MMAKKNYGHFKILLGDDRSEHALAAVALLEDLPFASGTDQDPRQSEGLFLCCLNHRFR
jgi:hypothetical protein